MFDVDRYGPWAVIAGGSEGVGSAFARHLAEAGANLVLIARKPEPLAATAEQCRALGADVHTVAADLTDPSTLELIRATTDDLDVGLFIYNAGANTYGHEFVSSDLARVQKVIDLNITALLAATRHYGERLARRGRGGIVLLGSAAGYYGQANISIYAAVKAFGRIFAEGLWLELRDHGVDVLELVLGLTRTPAMERAGLNFDAPGMRASEPEDVAREGLAHLGDGPVWIAGGNAASVEATAGPDRARIVTGRAEAMRTLLNRTRGTDD